MLPYLLLNNELAFKAFSALTNNIGDDSISLLTESDEAIDCLMAVLDGNQSNMIQLSLEIVCNILGEGEGYWKLFVSSKLLDKCVNLMNNSGIKVCLLKMLCNFVF